MRPLRISDPGAASELHDSPIVWRESPDVYKPAPRKLSEFLSGIELGLPCAPGFGAESSLLIFIEQGCMEAMESHVRSDLLKEQAGILCGQAYVDESGGHYVAVTSALPVHTLSGPAHFSFHQKSWDTVWAKLECASNILGWYHSHPGMGIFLSATDLRTQELYFSAPWQIAVVLDPVSRELGGFSGADGRQVHRDTFYQYGWKPGL